MNGPLQAIDFSLIWGKAVNWLKKLFGGAAATQTVKKATASEKRPKKPGVPATVRIAQFGSFDFDVVGEASYQAHLWQIVGSEKDEGHEHVVTVWLVCETGNPHDRNAVAVVVEEKTVGYLRREDAREYRKSLRESTGGHPSAVTKGLIIGGGIKRKTGERMHLGIRIDLCIPVDLE